MFNCILCNFSSLHQRNYSQHCKTQIHLKNEENKLYCCKCDKYFKTLVSYKTHKIKYHNNKKKEQKQTTLINNNINNNKNINNINNKDINDKLDDINNNINNNINDVKQEINNSKKEVVTVVNKAINKASSLIKYLMENHRSVPPLQKITRKQCIPQLRLEYECPEKENDYSLQKLFIKDHHRNLFVPNIAKSILKMINYNNKNKQAIYNTDSTRYNYVIKTTSEIWNEDKSGIKFTDYIIRPLLRYIRELVEDYIDNYLDKINMYKNNQYENEILLDEKEQAYTFDTALFHEQLIKPLLKELTPHLRFLQEELDELEKFEELEKIQEDLQEIIDQTSDMINNSTTTSKKTNINYNTSSDSDDTGDYIKKIKTRII